MESVYLSSETPRWTLTSEDHLHAAISRGMISETHYLDAKRELPTTKGGNRELARDLASFAIDGGTLIIGLEEDKQNGTFSLQPQTLAGAEEHVEQVARDIPDPPLAVITRVIRSETDETRGYLVVHIPPSPVAPHMVDSKYLGRGDKTKLYLSDPEVRRLHDLRRVSEADGLALLQVEFERDPVPAEHRKQAHLFLLAEPVAAQPEVLLGLTAGRDWNIKINNFLLRAFSTEVNEALKDVGDFRPDLLEASNGARRPEGAARTSPSLSADRVLQNADRETEVVEIEIRDDGGMRIFMGRLGDTTASGANVLFDAAAVIYVRRLLALVQAAAEEGGYFGNWILGVGATGLRGRPSYELRTMWGQALSNPRYTDDVYRRATTVSYPELVKEPGRVAERLLGRLLRALGTSENYGAARP